MKMDARKVSIGANSELDIFTKRASEGKKIVLRGLKTDAVEGIKVYLYIDEDLENPNGWNATALSLVNKLDYLNYEGETVKIKIKNTGSSSVDINYVITWEEI